METIQEIKVASIKLGENARRINAKEISKSSLYESIKNFGVRVPIIIRKDGEYNVLVSGNRRYACIKALKIERVKAIVMNGTTKEEDVGLVNFLENACREDLNPIEQGKAAAILLE